jgi:hypothetical protein
MLYQLSYTRATAVILASAPPLDLEKLDFRRVGDSLHLSHPV